MIHVPKYLILIGIFVLSLRSGRVVSFLVQSRGLTGPTSHEFEELRESEISCGPACLWYLLRANGDDRLLTSIPSPPCPRPNGWTFHDLRDSARLMGFSASAEVCDWQHLCRRLRTDRPFGILHVDDQHFVLAFVTTSRMIRVFDPASLRCLNSRELHERYVWNGAVLYLCDGTTIARQ
jgi:ABC-type bacteriocin/lantibiotic exporter with double-glycine peptidase domain